MRVEGVLFWGSGEDHGDGLVSSFPFKGDGVPVEELEGRHGGGVEGNGAVVVGARGGVLDEETVGVGRGEGGVGGVETWRGERGKRRWERRVCF